MNNNNYKHFSLNLFVKICQFTLEQIKTAERI